VNNHIRHLNIFLKYFNKDFKDRLQKLPYLEKYNYACLIYYNHIYLQFNWNDFNVTER